MDRSNFRQALKITFPIFLGYISFGIALGVLMTRSGYSFLATFFSSTIMYAGSSQFLLVELLNENASFITAFVMVFFLNSRHIFYGLSFLDDFKSFGKLKDYMIFTLTDETYALLCSLKDKEAYQNKRLVFMISGLNHIYWIMGACLGAVLGKALPFDSTGIDFAMTALFITIAVSQFEDDKDHFPALCGLGVGLLALFILGKNDFMLPALLTVMAILLLRGNKNG